jgi:hypothetical protein
VISIVVCGYIIDDVIWLDDSMKSVDVIQEHSHICVLFYHILTTWDHFEFMDIKDPNIRNFLLFKTFFLLMFFWMLNVWVIMSLLKVDFTKIRIYENFTKTEFFPTNFFLLNFLYQNQFLLLVYIVYI